MRSPLRRPAAPDPKPTLHLPQTVSDGDLFARLRADDTDALDAALKQHWSLVVDYIKRLTVSVDAAEDVAQRTFCQLWDRRSQWRSEGSMRALLCRIARNYAISEHRRESADERSAAVFAELNEPVSPVRDSLEAEQLRSALDREISLLPARRRDGPSSPAPRRGRSTLPS